MDINSKKCRNNYERVMSRVNNLSRSTMKASSFVTRNDTPSSERVGAKPSVSNLSSNVFSDLPIVLNDYVPESSSKKVSKKFVVKPRKTLSSLDPSKTRPVSNVKQGLRKPSNIRVPDSAPSVLRSNNEQWSEKHYRDCLSSRSHSKLKELKNEIHAYHETEKLMKIRSNLFRKCGVVLDDVGNIAVDKAVQVEELTPGAEAAVPEAIRRRTWIEVIGRPDLLTTSTKSVSHFVCSLHFDESMIKYVPQLKPNAVPTISLPLQNQPSTSNLNTTEDCKSVSTQTNESFISDLSAFTIKGSQKKSSCVKTTSNNASDNTTQTAQKLSSDSPRKRKLLVEHKETEKKELSASDNTTQTAQELSSDTPWKRKLRVEHKETEKKEGSASDNTTQTSQELSSDTLRKRKLRVEHKETEKKKDALA